MAYNTSTFNAILILFFCLSINTKMLKTNSKAKWGLGWWMKTDKNKNVIIYSDLNECQGSDGCKESSQCYHISQYKDTLFLFPKWAHSMFICYENQQHPPAIETKSVNLNSRIKDANFDNEDICNSYCQPTWGTLCGNYKKEGSWKGFV